MSYFLKIPLFYNYFILYEHIYLGPKIIATCGQLHKKMTLFYWGCTWLPGQEFVGQLAISLNTYFSGESVFWTFILTINSTLKNKHRLQGIIFGLYKKCIGLGSHTQIIIQLFIYLFINYLSPEHCLKFWGYSEQNEDDVL